MSEAGIGNLELGIRKSKPAYALWSRTQHSFYDFRISNPQSRLFTQARIYQPTCGVTRRMLFTEDEN